MKTRNKAAIALTMGLVAAAGSVAQTIVQEDLERCANETTAERKLACFEALTLAGAHQDEGEPMKTGSGGVSEASPPAAKDMTEPPSGPATVPLTANAVAAGNPTTIDPSPAVEKSVALDELGKEYLEKKTGQPGVVTATVVEVTRGRYDILTFHFANGQVWRQVQARRFRHPKKSEFDVSISTGMMGDYQLRVEGDGPMTRIRRIK